MPEQKTLASPARLEGVGLHTGVEVRVEMVPADAGTGVVFVRTDLRDRPRVEARVENLAARPRRTALVKGEAEVHTTEHLLAALSAAGVGNVEVRIDGPELPGLDGSALPFYEAIREAGVEPQGCRAREIRLRQPLVVTEHGASLVAAPAEEGLRVGYTLDYGSLRRAAPAGTSAFPPTASPAATGLDTQFLDLEITEETFAREIAPARTFVFEEEIRELQAAGLGKGASTKNTLVLGRTGIVDNELRFRDEFVRHKILDLLGDLFLLGSRLNGRILATKSGHALNVRLAKLILESASREREVDDVLAKARSGLDLAGIQKILPHRYPFLLIDRILEVQDGLRAVGIKNVTANEGFFQGHFPGHPVMPGVLVIEAMAQLGGVLLLARRENARRNAFLMSLDNVKFRKTVEPGDQILLEAELTKLKSRSGEVKARARVNGDTVAEAEIRFMLVDPPV